MHMHVLYFNSLQEKRIAWDWIEQNISTFDRDECLTEKKCKFYTDIALPVRKQKELVKAVQPASYLAEEL